MRQPRAVEPSPGPGAASRKSDPNNLTRPVQGNMVYGDIKRYLSSIPGTAYYCSLIVHGASLSSEQRDKPQPAFNPEMIINPESMTKV